MSIADQLEKLKETKSNIKNAIQTNLKKDLTGVSFVDYHNYITGGGGGEGGYCAPILNLTFLDKTEYIVGEEIVFMGVTSNPDGSILISGVPITYDGKVVATSDAYGTWKYTTTWKSGGCTFSIVDSDYGVVAEETAYPQEKFYDTFDNLQAKINQLSRGETLTLDCNYRGTSKLTISKVEVTIDGQGKFILDSQKSDRILNIDGNNITLKGLTFQNGYTAGNGGAVYNYSSTNCTITGCIFRSNIADSNGGAIWNNGKGLTIYDTIFEFNESVMYGGAIQNVAAQCTISHSTFKSNGSKYGGGIANSGVQCMILQSFFNYNKGGGYGGAIYNIANNSSILHSTFTHNTAQSAGPVLYNDSTNTMCEYNYYGTQSPDFTELVKNIEVDNYIFFDISVLNSYLTVKAISNSNAKVIMSFPDTTAVVKADETYTYELKDKIIRQSIIEPTKPYTITVQIGDGEEITKTIEE